MEATKDFLFTCIHRLLPDALVFLGKAQQPFPSKDTEAVDNFFIFRYDSRYKRSTNAPIVHISITYPWTSCGIAGGLGIF